MLHSCAVVFCCDRDAQFPVTLSEQLHMPTLYWYIAHTLCPAAGFVLILRRSRTMSGRLIILPKKSWHPGKRENIEKVLRDERLASEEAAQAQERARELTQESIIETLSKKRNLEKKREGRTQGNQAPGSRKRGCTVAGKGCDEGPAGEGQGWGATSQHVNLFSEAEREAKKQLGQNEDYQREKKKEELTAQRRSGLAPTALGDGSAELKGADSQPWYTQVKASEGGTRTTRLGREVTGEEAAEALKRDDKRKGRADPLGSLFKSDPHPHPYYTESSNKDRIEQSVTLNSTPSAESRGHGKGASPKEGSRGKSSKKEKKHKKHKKHKKRKSSIDGNTGTEDDYSRGDSGDSTAEVGRQQRLDDLRRRRLAREGGERERQIRLLAERQMAGLPLPDERRMTYNNQYNATVARQNRQHSFH